MYGIKPVQFLPQFHGEVNQLIPKIYARLIEDEDDSPMNVGIDRLKEILTRFSPNFPFSEKAFRNIYRKLYSVPYSVPERKYFGRSTFYEVMLLLKEHGVSASCFLYGKVDSRSMSGESPKEYTPTLCRAKRQMGLVFQSPLILTRIEKKSLSRNRNKDIEIPRQG